MIRHDLPDSQYRIDPRAIPALVDLPDEGHGTLIAPRWVITAAHAVNMMQSGDSGGLVTIDVPGRIYLAGVTHGLDGTTSEVKNMFRQLQDGTLRMGTFGQRFAAARVGYYVTWIDRMMASH